MEKNEAMKLFVGLMDRGWEYVSLDDIATFVYQVWGPGITVEPQVCPGRDPSGKTVWANAKVVYDAYEDQEDKGLSYYGIMDETLTANHETLDQIFAEKFGLDPDQVDIPECRRIRLKVITPRKHKRELWRDGLIAAVLGVYSMVLDQDIVPTLNAYAPSEEWTEDTITYYFEFGVGYGS